MDPQPYDPKYQNFVTVYRGFAYVGKALEPYTIAGLQRTHQRAYRACAGLPPCLQQCSRTHGQNITTWCGTCKAWRNALLRERKGTFNKWKNTESWNWSASYDNIANVFLPPSWDASGITLNEFATACHIWTICNELNVGNALLKKVRELRNKHHGHNPNLTIDTVGKTKVFDALKELVRAQDVQAYLNVGQCIQDLDSIAKGETLNVVMGNIENKLHELFLKIESHDNTQKQILSEIRNQRDSDDGWRLSKIYSCCLTVLAVIAVFAILTFVKKTAYLDTVVYRNYTDCFSETYSYPFPQDLYLLPYFKEHSKLIGRTWLFEDIDKYIYKEEVSEKGSLITANMGYGKSAIVKHLLCSHPDEKDYKIRSHIAAFHLCRFDVPSTKNPQRFIHRLVGFLSTHLPEYGALISLLPETAVLFNEEQCRQEIIACFDQGILHPLQEMNTIDRVVRFIVIDALDECYDTRINNNELYDLLRNRYKQFPKWIKFIITSRNISLLQHLHHLKHYSLDSGDLRNKKDIMQYIEQKASIFPALRNFEGGLDKFVDQSEGLFLFVVHLLEMLTTNDNGVEFEFPETLSGVYEMNFERHFHSAADYKIARSILEIVIVSIHPLCNTDVAIILDYLNVSKRDTTEMNFERIAFCFRSSQELTFIHQTIHVWLVSPKDSKMFHVSAERGHAMLSRYLLNQINNSRADIVDIAIHIGNSNDTTLEKAFSGIYSNRDLTNSTLHKLVWKSDSARALILLLDFQTNVDAVNEGKVTPAFVAAARGHLNQLKLLQSKGADMNFKVNASYLITSPSHIDIIKHDYFFGYGLIHIPAKFGHYETVEYLLKQNQRLHYISNGLNLTVAEVVCENGHVKLLELVLRSKDNIGNCLYYAAKNNHISIVKRLVIVGVNASCISHTDATHALAKLRDIDMTKLIFTLHADGMQHAPLNLNDLWWVMNQESPLHAAIKAKDEEMAMLLITHFPHLTRCVDPFGMTPFLWSVTGTNVFKTLVKIAKKDTCRNVSTLLHFQQNSDVPICPVGGNYAHLDGIYGRYKMTKYIYKSGIAIDWFIPDLQSISAAHYAACNGNSLFLMFLTKYVKQSLSNIRSDNLSTPYHSAAICGSLKAFYAMTDAFKNPPPESYDIENKTLLHYIVMRELRGYPADVDSNEQDKSLLIFQKLLESGLNVEISDSRMRNILHYALKNGNFSIIGYMISNVSISFKELIKQRDIYGHSPVEYATKRETSRKVDIQIKIPPKCPFYDIVFTYCDTDGQYDQYFSSWELGLFIPLRFATVEVTDDFSHAFKDILIQSPYLTVAMLVYMKAKLHLSHLRKTFIKSISFPLSFWSVLAVARHIPEVFTVCGKSLSESPLHKMAYKYHMDALASSNFLHLAFGEPIDTYALNCADSSGYNSFHYALMGGSICMAITLLDVGVSITNKKVSIKDVIFMVVSPAKKHSVQCSPECIDRLSCMDHLLETVFKKYTDNILYSDVCTNMSTDLSLVHIVAASGMENTMKILYAKFGKKIFACQNKDRIKVEYM